MGYWRLLLLLLLLGLNSHPAAQPLENIDTLLQPLLPDEPYIVDIGIKIDQIVNIDQKSENFEVVGNIWIEWDDETLAFDPEGRKQAFRTYTVEEFTRFVDQHDIFGPGFVIYNQQGRRFKQDSKVVVFEKGHALFIERFTATLQAPEFDFTRYPFDKQKFFLHVDAVKPLGFLEFRPLEGFSGLGDKLGEEEWVFERSWTMVGQTEGITGKPTSRFSFGFEAGRHLNYYYLRIFLPLLIIVLVSWVTFFLQDYGKRVDIAIANLLVFVAFNFTISNDLPRLGYLTFIDTIMFSAFVFSGLVVIVNVIFRRMEVLGRESLARRMDNYTIWIYPVTLGILVSLFWFVFLAW